MNSEPLSEPTPQQTERQRVFDLIQGLFYASLHFSQNRSRFGPTRVNVVHVQGMRKFSVRRIARMRN